MTEVLYGISLIAGVVAIVAYCIALFNLHRAGRNLDEAARLWREFNQEQGRQ